MKKLVIKLLTIWFLIFLLFPFFSYASSCQYSEGGSVGSIVGDINSCLSWWNLVDPWSGMKIEDWVKAFIIKIVKNISIILSLSAIGFIAYWSMMLVLSWWNDEKIKKWKEIIKWSILWFIALLSTSWVIALVVNIIYGINW